MNYRQELTFQLRVRGRSEAEIADTLREIDAHGLTDTALPSEFGSPESYASGFDQLKRQSPGRRLSALAVVIAVAWAVTWITLGLAWRFLLQIDPPEWTPDAWMISWTALGIGWLGVLAGYLIDKYKPVAETSAAHPPASP